MNSPGAAPPRATTIPPSFAMPSDPRLTSVPGRVPSVNTDGPGRAFRQESLRGTRSYVKPEAKRMTIPEWVKTLRARLGFTSQEAFAEALHLKNRSTVAKWESGTQNPGVSSWKKLWTRAPLDLKVCAPAEIAGVGVADQVVIVDDAMPKGYITTSKEAATVAEELDSIEDPFLRRRARNAALKCIEECLRGPQPPALPPSDGPQKHGKT